MGGSQPSTTTQINKVELPKWVDEASQKNYDLATGIADKKYSEYTGPMVAPTGASTKKAYDLINMSQGDTGNAIAGTDPIWNKMLKNANGLKYNDIDPMMLSSRNLTGVDLSGYMNPYTNEVENHAMAALEKSRQQSTNSNSAAATAAGAFGGSRHGVVDAVTNAETATAAGDLSAQLRQQGYDRATSLAMGDLERSDAIRTGNANRQLTADSTNADNILNYFNSKNSALSGAATGKIGAAEAAQGADMKDFAALSQAGMSQQQQAQAILDAKKARGDRVKNSDIDDLNLRLSALGMSPYGKTETTDKTTTGGSSGTDWGQMGMGVFSLLLGLSEDDTKTDKEKVGMVPGTDLEMWAFRYKKDPKHYPKVVGVMASDVEKKMPDAVHRVDGKRVINYGMIGEAMRANG